MKANPLFLIAEDDPDDQVLIRDAIKEVCAPTLEAHFVWDGFELLDFLKTNGKTGTNLIVLDLNMPGKDGRTALREIKADPNLANIPLVILTTSQNELDFEYCQNYGVTEYYQKPNSMSELKKIFHILCTTYMI